MVKTNMSLLDKWDWIRFALGAAIVVCNFFVWRGVKLEESESFGAKEIGKRLLLNALAWEFFFALALLAVDTTASFIQKREIENLRLANNALETQIQPRRLTLDQQKAITRAFLPFSNNGQTVRITSYALDVEGLGLAKQLAAIFEKAHVRHADNFASVAAMDTNIVEGVNVSGPNVALTDAIASAYHDKGQLVISRKPDPVPGAALRSAPILPDSAIAAFVFVGVKPIKIIK